LEHACLLQEIHRTMMPDRRRRQAPFIPSTFHSLGILATVWQSQRDVSVISLQNDIRYALRSLLRSPGFVVAAVSSLGLAIAASVAAFSIIDTIRFRELPFPAASRLVLFGESAADAPDARLRRCDRDCTVRYETWDNVIRTYPFRSLDAVAGFGSGAKSFSTGTDAILLTGGIVTPNVFALLEATPILG